MVVGGVGGEERGWCEGEKEWLAAGAKVVSSGLWNQELFALHSATPLHYYHCNTHTSTHALQLHDLCSAPVLLEC